MEMADAMTNQPARATRFTLREMLLAMTAIAAVLALVVQTWNGRRETPLFRSLALDTLAQTAMQEAGCPMGSRSSGSGGSRGGKVARRHFQFAAHAKDVPATTIMAHLQKLVKAEIDRHGAKVTGTSTSGYDTNTGVREFGYAYELNGRNGELNVTITSDAPETFAFSGTLFEFTAR